MQSPTMGPPWRPCLHRQALQPHLYFLPVSQHEWVLTTGSNCPMHPDSSSLCLHHSASLLSCSPSGSVCLRSRRQDCAMTCALAGIEPLLGSNQCRSGPCVGAAEQFCCSAASTPLPHVPVMQAGASSLPAFCSARPWLPGVQPCWLERLVAAHRCSRCYMTRRS